MKRASLVAQSVKSLPAVRQRRQTQVQSLGWKDPLEEGMATHSNMKTVFPQAKNRAISQPSKRMK